MDWLSYTSQNKRKIMEVFKDFMNEFGIISLLIEKIARTKNRYDGFRMNSLLIEKKKSIKGILISFT